MKSDNIIVILTLLLAGLILCTSITGTMTPGFYGEETAGWRAQAIAQDYINLCLMIPFLLNTALMIFKKSQEAKLLWAGAVAYIVYTFTIYCFDIHFNHLFILYCTILGTSILSLAYFIYTHRNTFMYKMPGRQSGRITGIYFMVIAVFFAFLWLADILPAIFQHRTPQSLAEGGLFTNPVHVIDLSVLLPGLFIVGLLLIRRKKPGMVLAPVLLTFMLLMFLTIGVLTLQAAPVRESILPALILFVFAAFSCLLLVLYLRSRTAVV